jgi:hypothetical protein
MPYNRARQLVEQAVPQHIERWAALIGLKPTDAGFARFREDMTEALHAGMQAHIDDQGHLKSKLTRVADMRPPLKQEAREARALAQRLRAFASKYVTGHATLILRLGQVFDPGALAEDFDALASLREDQAAACKDSGGPTRKMRAFTALAEGLTRAYSRATGRKGTGGNVREGDSRLRKLVEAVLPEARKITEAMTGKPLTVPRSGGLGDHLDEIAKRLVTGV